MVDALCTDIISPILGTLFGRGDAGEDALSTLTFKVLGVSFTYGAQHPSPRAWRRAPPAAWTSAEDCVRAWLRAARISVLPRF